MSSRTSLTRRAMTSAALALLPARCGAPQLRKELNVTILSYAIAVDSGPLVARREWANSLKSDRPMTLGGPPQPSTIEILPERHA
jgi:hypothetical protein